VIPLENAATRESLLS